MRLVKFQISCPVFWGHNQYIDIDKFNNLEAIMNYFLDTCEEFYKFNNLLDLHEFFKTVKKMYHIHDLTFEMLNNFTTQDMVTKTVYVCRHNNCNTTLDNIIINR